MDYVLLTLAIALMIIGLLGCVLPVLPGPPLSYAGLLLAHFTRWADFSTRFLVIMAMVAVVVTVLDYIVPIWGTKRFGGTKAGMWGATIGMVVGIFFFPPIGLILGPLIGAIAGEAMRGADSRQSIVAGLGSLMGFFLGIGLKLAASLAMTYYFVKALL
ncbi:MAG TPA: DUF456 domain-containing protein [Bacteroidetes bacterium]|nr:DUF456 domain-containing protein [Bacteroidota bacterium]